jgi:hypothetical protein
MSFRTLGWFGPNCPLPLPPPPTPFSPPQEFKDTRMYNLQTKETVNEFPLDIAMKIFWEAETISFEASVSALFFFQNQLTSGSFSGSESAVWSEIDLDLSPSSAREPVQTAKELLCILKRPSSLFPNNHTVKLQAGNLPRTNIAIQSREFADEEFLYAPFSISIEGGLGPPSEFGTFSAGAQIFTTSVASINANQVGFANWITPWGNATSPLFFSGIFGTETHVSSSMTITVTAANPATRYA